MAVGAIMTGPNKALTGLSPELYYTIPAFALTGVGAAPMFNI